MINNSIKPGKPWLDTNGNRIQAHGGSVLYADGKFYWYGENKEKTTGPHGIWQWGVRLYSSGDLYNWKDEGIICLPELNDKTSPLHPESMMDRPHILYNEKTKKYVMWMKIMESDFEQYMTVAVSDSIKGPFEIVNKKLHPGGMSSGDFDLVQLEDGRAYIVFDRVHYDMVVLSLTDDYLDTTVEWSEHYYRKSPPYVREAPAVFFRHQYSSEKPCTVRDMYSHPEQRDIFRTGPKPHILMTYTENGRLSEILMWAMKSIHRLTVKYRAYLSIRISKIYT